jgi:hypothetical protein
MKKTIIILFFVSIIFSLFLVFFLPKHSIAADPFQGAGASGEISNSPTKSESPEGIAPTGSASLSNLDPLKNAGGLQGIINSIFNIAYAAAGVIAVAYLIVGGYQYITSQGNPDATATAKGTIVNSIIGLIIILASYLIIRFALEQLRVGNLLG